jgi:hypothetical protein
MRRRMHAHHMRRRIHTCKLRCSAMYALNTAMLGSPAPSATSDMRRRIHACHMRRRIHAWLAHLPKG